MTLHPWLRVAERSSGSREYLNRWIDASSLDAALRGLVRGP